MYSSSTNGLSEPPLMLTGFNNPFNLLCLAQLKDCYQLIGETSFLSLLLCPIIEAIKKFLTIAGPGAESNIGSPTRIICDVMLGCILKLDPTPIETP